MQQMFGGPSAWGNYSLVMLYFFMLEMFGYQIFPFGSVVKIVED